jgi:hypothetical protein
MLAVPGGGAVAVREHQAVRALPTAAGRLAALRRVVLALAVITAALGGVAVWRAIDRLDDEWARHAVVQGEMADLERVIGARLDEAVGVAGLSSGAPTNDTELQAQLDDLVTWAGVTDEGDLRDEVTTREAELTEATRASGAVDERLLFGLESALRELDRTTVRRAVDAAHAAHDTARRTLVIVVVLSAGLGCAATWVGHILRTRYPPAGNETTRPRA